MLLIYPKSKGIINLYNKIKSKGASIYAKCLFLFAGIILYPCKSKIILRW